MDTHSDNVEKAVDEAVKSILIFARGTGRTEAAKLVAERFGFTVSEKTDIGQVAAELGIDLP